MGLEILFGWNPLLLLGELVNWPEIRPIPAIPAEEPRQPGGPLPDDQAPIIWDADQVRAAIHAIWDEMEVRMATRISDSGRQERIFDSDSESGLDSDASRSSSSGVVSYPSLHHLEVGAFTLIVPDSMAHLERILHSLPEGHHKETIMRACPRFCEVLENALMHHVGSEALSDPFVLTDKSTKNWVLRLKCTAIVYHWMWKQLEEENQQLHRELKQSCFEEVAGQSMNNLLSIASSFSDPTRWSANDHIIYMLPIFTTLVEVLDYIKELPFRRSDTDTIQNNITGIYGKIVRSMCVIHGQIANDRRIRSESSIHSATRYLMQALKFFCDNKDMLQAVLGSGDYTEDLHDRWVLKLEEDAGRLFKNRKDQQYIFILNNGWFVFKRKFDPNVLLSDEQVERVNSVIQKYKKIYLDEFWVPLLTYVERDSSRWQNCSSLDKFTTEFETTCSHRRILKVLTELKVKLVEEIMILGLGPNGIFSRFSENEMQSGKSFWRKTKSILGFREKRKSMTIADFENMF